MTGHFSCDEVDTTLLACNSSTGIYEHINVRQEDIHAVYCFGNVVCVEVSLSLPCYCANDFLKVLIRTNIKIL